RRFIVNKTVLEPRPESEDIISLLTSLNLTGTPTIVDIGTGSGALAISAKLEIPKATLLATDIDPKCLKVAKANAQMHKAEVMFYKGDLLAAAPSRIIDIIMANLPYVPDSHKINRAAAMEPRTAIFGGSDGLEIYRRLFSGLPTSKPGCILTESLPPQHRKLASIAKSANYRLMKTEGFIQLFVPTP
ncbi:MAG: methyltransferase, partial [Candidatus Saccharimonadales bacterium]